MNNTSLHDPKNIAGLSSLISDDKFDMSTIAEIEKELIKGSANIQKPEDPAKMLQREMGQFDFGNFSNDVTNISESDNLRDSLMNIGSDSPEQPSTPQPTKSYKFSAPPDDYDTEITGNLGFKSQDRQMQFMTEEQAKQRNIDEALRMGGDDEMEFNIDKEREADEKARKLEQIDMLRETLEDDGIALDRIPEVSKLSSMKEIEDVHKILLLKNDRSRYCALAEEVFLSVAYGMESVFNGEREIFGRKPDLTGWPETVKVKLRRMKFETSTFVSGIMQEWRMGPGLRLALELIPSMFLYSRKRRLAQTDSVANNAEFQNAISVMNDLQ